MSKLPKLHKSSVEKVKRQSLLKKEDKDLLYNLSLSRAGSIIAENYDHILSERELLFVSHYANPLSDGYRNAAFSASQSGFSAESARRMVKKDWFRGLQDVINEIFLTMAEQRLFEIMMMDPREKITVTKTTKTGIQKTKVSERVNPGLLRVIADMSKFAAERKGKGEWNPKLTLEHEAGPKTIAELFNHLNNNNPRKINAITVDDGGSEPSGQGVEDKKPLLHNGQEQSEDTLQSE